MRDSVAAVVVTYNRPELLDECLSALLGQTRALERIVLVDNASTEATLAMLEARGYLADPRIDYTRLARNTGGAGGFRAGCERAFSLGYSWLWLMDDDAEPEPQALERMIPAMDRPGSHAVANLVVDAEGQPQRDHRGWLHLYNLSPRAHRPLPERETTADIDISFASFVGLAVHRRAMEAVGFPKAELFLKGDDLEYCVRLAELGPIRLVADSRIRHKDGMAAGYEVRKRLGRSSPRQPLDRLWLGYFSLRNLVWMRRQYCGPGLAAAYSVQQFARHAFGILLYDRDRGVRLRFYASAVGDAWRDVFDNEKPRRLTRVTPAARTAPSA